MTNFSSANLKPRIMNSSKPNLVNVLYAVLILLIPLGQFGRFQLGSNLAVYYHDLLIPFLVLFWLIAHLKLHLPFILPRFWAWLPAFGLAALISIVLSTANSADQFTSLLYLIRWLNLALLFPVTYDLLRHRLLTLNLEKFLLLAALIVAVAGLLQYTLIPDTRSLFLLGWDDHYNRLIATLFDPSFTGAILIFGLILVWKTKAHPLLEALLLVSLALTYSRASYLTLAVVLVLNFCLVKNRLHTLLLGFLFTTLMLLLPTNLGEGTNLARSNSVTSRLESSQSALSNFRDHALTGSGFYSLPTKLAPRPGIVSHTSAPDNSYLLLLSTTGLIGFLVYFYFHLRIFHCSLRHRALFLTLAALSLHALFNNTLFYPFISIWIWLLLANSFSGGTKQS